MPNATSAKSPYFQFVTLYDIEEVVKQQLRTWIVAYLAEIERQAGLSPQTIPVPPDPDHSFTGGIDFDTWQAAYTPQLITTVAPIGEPERQNGNRTYVQAFEIRIAAVIQAEDEYNARRFAQWYGMAIAGAIGQHGSLGIWPGTDNTVALDTVMTAYPVLSFPDPDPDARRISRVEVGFQTVVDKVLVGAGAPTTPPTLPYAIPGAFPEVTSIHVEFDAVPLTEPV